MTLSEFIKLLVSLQSKLNTNPIMTHRGGCHIEREEVRFQPWPYAEGTVVIEQEVGEED